MVTEFLLYWIVPALPGLANLAVAWIAERGLFGRNLPAWQTAHQGRLAGIVVFVAAGWMLNKVGMFDVQAFSRQQWPVSLQEVLAIALMVGILFAFQVSRRKKDPPAGLDSYRMAHLSPARLSSYAWVWVAYLFCYEVYFRGYLLYSAMQNSSQWVLIVYNLVLYALVHVYKSAQQAVAAIPFGLVLCLVTFWSGHFWFAWLVHTWLALGFELPLLAKPSNHISDIKTQA